jgi:hypothetical protein
MLPIFAQRSHPAHFQPSPCACGCPGQNRSGCPKARLANTIQTPRPEELPQEAVTNDYIINLFNWIGDLPFPLNTLAYFINCFLHTLTAPMLFYIAPNLWSHLKQVWNSPDDLYIKAFRSLQFYAFNLYGSAVCSCLPAELWYYAAIGYFKVQNQKDAEDAMRHYREGAGRDFRIDVARLLREDPGVKRCIEEGIQQQGQQSGRLEDWLSQDAFESDNWLNTLGGVDLVTYDILAGPTNGVATVLVGIRDPYEWHPDVGRALPCLHTSMENLKHLGARDYMQVGKARVTLNLPSW